MSESRDNTVLRSKTVPRDNTMPRNNTAPQEAKRRSTRFSAFGQTIESRFPLQTALLGSAAAPTLHFDLHTGLRDQLSAAPVFYQSRRRHPGGGSVVQLHRLPGGVGIRLADGVDFVLQAETIGCELGPAASLDEGELNFFGVALPLWLEMRGELVFHAACVASGERAIGLLGGCGAGKTTLAMELLRGGFSLVTDDHLAVDLESEQPMAMAAVPELRLWPSQAERYFGPVERFSPVSRVSEKLRVPLEASGESFAARQSRLAAFYLVERVHQVEPLLVEPLSARDALHALLRYSALPLLCEAVGLRAQRLDQLSRLAASVPVRRLRCRDGMESLASLVECFREEIAKV